jgi:L-iditol 2-dehydrogenase
LEVHDLPSPPRLLPGEVRLRVSACGICGSELESFKHRSARRPPPLVMGHEFCGVIEEVGSAVSGWQAGEAIVSNALVPCRECVRCRRGDSHLCADRQLFGMNRPGAFAEAVNVPAHCLLPWPKALPAEAACLAEPLANGVHVVNLTQHLPAETVLVIGAGPIGLLCQQAFQVLRGSRVWVADLSAERRMTAERLGAERVLDPQQEDVVTAVLAATGGEGTDLTIDAVGAASTKATALAALRPGGASVWIGLTDNQITLESYGITLLEKHVYGTYSAKLEELRMALDLLSSGRVSTASWVQTFPLSQGVEAFYRMAAAAGNDIKAVLVP